MGRWRPPVKPGSPYITPQGADKLHAELQHLWHTQRPEVVKALAAAAAEGDRSENAEYTYRKKQLGGIDRRVRYLSKRLDVMRVVGSLPADQSIVRFGAWVSLTSSAVEPREYRIVGVDETDAALGYISIDSPVAKALLGKTVGESCVISLPECEATFAVIAIRY